MAGFAIPGERIGCLVIAGHGLPDPLVRRVFDVSKALLPIDRGLVLAIAMALSIGHATGGPRGDVMVVSITACDTLWAEIAEPGYGLAAYEMVRAYQHRALEAERDRQVAASLGLWVDAQGCRM